MLFRSLKTNDIATLLSAYTVYVRPIVEYASVVWSPHLLRDIAVIESVQRDFTRRLFHRCNFLPDIYSHRLKFLKLESLELRRINADLAVF